MAKLIEITGKAISGEWGNDDTGTGIPVLRTTNFTNDGVINYNNVITRDIQKKDLSQKYLQPGDIIIEKSGGSDKQPVGRVVYFDGESNRYLFNNFTGCLRIRNKKLWYPRYVFYALYGNYINGGTRRYENKTTGLHNLKTEQYVRDFSIQEYSLEYQQMVVEKLDKACELIALRKEQLSKLDELVKSRFIEMFGDSMTNSKGYMLKKYGDLFELNAGGTPSRTKTEYWDNGTISWIGSNMCQNTVIYKNDGNYITEEGLKHSSARMFPVDTVLIALVGATIGKTALLKFETTTNQNVLGVRGIRESGYTPEFIFHYTQGLYQEFLNIGDGGFAMASKGFISELPVPVVDLTPQEEFSAFVHQVDKSKFEIQKSLEKLETLKKALMQKYFG